MPRQKEGLALRSPVDPRWHARAGDDVLSALDSREHGLSQAEAAARLAAHGPNALPPAPARHPLVRFLSQLHNAPIYARLAAASGSIVFVKGAPEQLMEMARPMSDAVRARWAAALAEAAADGERVLAFGAKRLPPGHARVHFDDDVARGVEWLGLVGFIDPPRHEGPASNCAMQSGRHRRQDDHR